MILYPLQKPLHKLGATMLPAIIHKLIEYVKVFLKEWFECLLSEMDIDSCTSSPFIYAALDLMPKYQYMIVGKACQPHSQQ